MSFEPIFFQSRGAEEFRFLSNFWLSPFAVEAEERFDTIRVNGSPIVYPTVEHFYQASKASDNREHVKIAQAATPGEAKALGGKVAMLPDWETVGLWKDGLLTKDYFMLVGLRAKFNQNPDLRAKLIATRTRPLVEYAPWGDTYWGVNKEYVGRNMLGTLLTLVRATLGRTL